MCETIGLSRAGYRGVGLLAFLVSLLLASCATSSTEQQLAGMGGELCTTDSQFVCVSMEVPLDYSVSNEDTLEINYAVRPASGRRIGVLVTAVGGPGASGIDKADWIADSFDEAIEESFDLVFFDQRGVGLIEEPPCPETDEADFFDGDADSDWESLIDTMSGYFNACVDESGNADILPYLGTRHVVHDLEAFRQAMGYGKLTIYGRSYGTVVAQMYADEYPHSVERMVLDGPVDRTLDQIEETRAGITALGAILDVMFEECDNDHSCASDMDRPSDEVYDNLVVELTETPATVPFPVDLGVSEDISLTAEDVTYLAFQSAYTEEGRMLFLRALASYARDGELTPMMRLFAPGEGDGDSTLLNVAVNCLDSSLPGNDRTEETAALVDALAATPSEYRWVFGSVSVCSSWPAVDHTTETEPAFTGDGIPVLMVASEMDPATPYPGAVSIFENLDHGHLLTVKGGSHVMFGNGVACIDDAVNRFLFQEASPPKICEAPSVGPYLRLLNPSSN